MCINCWEHQGSPQVDNPKVREAARRIGELYQQEQCGAGGCLHVQVDDFNLEDDFFEDVQLEHFPQCTCNKARIEVENTLYQHLRAMSQEERFSAVALHDGYWGGKEQ